MVEVRRQRPTKRIREGGEVCLAARRPRRTRKVIEGASEASRRRERRSEAQQRRRSRGGAAVEAQQRRRSGLFAQGGPRGRSTRRRAKERTRTRPSKLWVFFLTPRLDQVVFVFGRRRPGRSAACRLLSAVARTQHGRWEGRPRAGLAARALNPPIPVGAENCVLPCLCWCWLM